MSITITTKPKAVDFSGNGLKYKVASGYVTTAAVKAQFYFKKKYALAEFEAFAVPIPGTTDTIGCVAMGITDGWPNSIRFNCTIDETIADLQNLYLIDKYYTITKNGTDNIYFETKEAMAIDTDLIEFLSEETNPGYEFLDPTYIISEGVDGVYEENFNVIAKINYEGEDICELQLDVDVAGNTELDAGKFLPRNIVDKGTVEYLLYDITNTFLFRVGFAENQDGSIYQYLFDSLIALPGKLQFNEYPDFDPTIPIFMTGQKKIESYLNAFHKLTFYLGTTIPNGGYTIYVTLYKKDGTETNVGIGNSEEQFYQMDFLISSLVGSEEDIYKIKLYSDRTGSDSVTIYLREEKFFDKQFMFVNRYGFWETMICSGNKKQSINTERELFKKHVTAGYTKDEGEYTQEVRQAYQQFEIETGYRESAEIDQIIEALKSKEFYEIDGTDFIKCEILNTETEVRNEEENVKNIIITYRYSFDD